MPIYEKATKDLMHIFAAEKLKPGQIFGTTDAVRWFAQHYPKIRDTTVRMHVDGMAVNSPSRKHHQGAKPGNNFDLFFKVGPAQYRLWDVATDPSPIYRGDAIEAIRQDEVGDETVAPQLAIDDPIAASQFAYETDLRDYLAKNLGKLNLG